MKVSPKDISTIVILSKNKQSTRTIQVRTHHLARLKYYALGLLGVLTLLIGSIVLLQKRSRQQEAEKQLLLTQIISLKGQIPIALKKEGEKNSAQSYIQAIEGKLKNINDYLRKRGLKGFSTKSVGGDGTADAKLTDKEVYMAYNDYLTHLVNSVAFTPMGYPRISSMTSSFGFRSDPFNSAHAEFHPGIDFKGERGDVAKCTANGRVVSAGWNGGYGNCVRVAHSNGFETLYGHLSRITVRVGQQLAVGDKVGEVGSTGRSTGAHLHYEVRKDGKPVNPVKFLTVNN
ncbi:M23 family metallopeptidase [Mucilaginibacter sp. UR6-11]|uniref:M23 family metallopeptidase n=1 Tax=Mucilaginibacter sp. UR6-11 TaxID=1435644 RepID=UPI001E4142BF|nr:M23 family metallopeptidase [Mucilaginibacter sp. UR6-11]MCC8424942.1 M23 family metallopeptidase [Mucilaginibacter sp. UR6-11]